MNIVNLILKNYKIIILVILVISILLNIKQCNNIKNERKIWRQNTEALTDTLKITKDKNGKLVYSNAIFLSDLKSLKELNSSLEQKIKEFNTKGGTVLGGTEFGGYFSNNNANGKGSVEPINPKAFNINDTLKNLLSDLGSYNVTWGYEDKDRVLKGNTIVKLTGKYNSPKLYFDLLHDKTTILKDSLAIKISLYEAKDRDGIIRIYARPENEKISITTLNAFRVPEEVRCPSTSRLGLGLYAGYGITYNNFNQSVNPGIQLGIGLNYNLIQFKSKKQ